MTELHTTRLHVPSPYDTATAHQQRCYAPDVRSGHTSSMAASVPTAAAAALPSHPRPPPASPPPIPSFSSTAPISPAPSSTAPRARSSPTHAGLYRWLHSRRFPIACLLCLSSIAASSYRLVAFEAQADAQQSTREDLTRTLERLQAQVDRRKAQTQQRLKATWAVPATTAPKPQPPPALSAALVCPASPEPSTALTPSSSSWLSWSGWSGWWRGDAAPTAPSSLHSAVTTSSSTVDSLPSSSLVKAVTSDCDYILHTGRRPTPSFLSAVLPSFDSQLISASPSPSSSPSPSVPLPPPASPSSPGAVTGAVTASGKRLMV